MIKAVIETSARHIHLSEHDCAILFPNGLHPKKHLSIEPEFACFEQVTIKCPRCQDTCATVLGPTRKQSQLEISYSDAYKMGLYIPERVSGDLEGAPIILVATADGQVEVPIIIAQKHIHTPENSYISCFDKANVYIDSLRGKFTLTDVVIRPTPGCSYNILHIDTDEANAFRASTCGIGIDNSKLISATLPMELTTKSWIKSSTTVTNVVNTFSNTFNREMADRRRSAHWNTGRRISDNQQNHNETNNEGKG